MTPVLVPMLLVGLAVGSPPAGEIAVGAGGRHERIADALAGARIGDRIVVKPGVYRETLSWPDVHGIQLVSAEGPRSTVIQGDGRGPVIHMDGEQKWDTLIEGFTVRGGGGGNVAGRMGAGINIRGASPTIRNCIVTDNTGRPYRGTGGIFLWRSRAVVENNLIVENSYQSPTLQAGGVCVWEGMPKIERNVIQANRGDQQAYFTRAAGVRLQGSEALVRGNVIKDNVSTSVGSAIYACQGDRSCVFGNEISGNRNTGGSFGAVAVEPNSSTLVGGRGPGEANSIHDNIHCFAHDPKAREEVRNLSPEYLGHAGSALAANWFGAAEGPSLRQQLQELDKAPPVYPSPVRVEEVGLSKPRTPKEVP